MSKGCFDCKVITEGILRKTLIMGIPLHIISTYMSSLAQMRKLRTLLKNKWNHTNKFFGDILRICLNLSNTVSDVLERSPYSETADWHTAHSFLWYTTLKLKRCAKNCRHANSKRVKLHIIRYLYITYSRSMKEQKQI